MNAIAVQAHTSKITYDVIWNTADKVLRNVVEPEEYGDYILPFAVLRRLECLLEANKPQVLEYIDGTKMTGKMLDLSIQSKFDLHFYNSSKFDLTTIAQVDDHVLESFLAYIDGFSESVSDVWSSFALRDKARSLHKANRLWAMCKRFSTIDMHPDNLTDMAMGGLFEDLMYRAFSTKGKGAGAFYTPRDAIRLMVDVLFNSDDEGLRGSNPVRSVYDPTAGTGGMLLVAARTLKDMNPNIDVGLYGQEMMDSAYAIGKADLLIQGGRPDAIQQGDTLREDKYSGQTFDYVLSNPPYGSDWSIANEDVVAESKKAGSRFSHGLPSTSDGQMLFLSHVASKMAPAGENGKGGRAGVVMNGSPLFAGGPGSGPDSIRAWLLENDIVDAIIALPTDIFYGTGIATYIWILDNNKEQRRKGKIQLIDATDQWIPMRKGMGDKRREMTKDNRKTALKAYMAFENSEISRIVTADDLGYRDVPVFVRERYATKVSEVALTSVLSHPGAKADAEAIEAIVRSIDGGEWNRLPDILKSAAKEQRTKISIGLIDTIMKAVAVHDDNAPLAVDRKGNFVIASGSKLTERISLSEDITEHMEREVLPYAPDAMSDDANAKVGYEIPFTRIFYVPEPVRSVEEIDSEVFATMRSLAEKFTAVQA